MEVCLCWRSSEVERLPCKQRVGGSNPLASSSRFTRLGSILAGSGRYPSGQRGQTVNLLAHAFGGSNPPLPTISTAAASGAERFAGRGPRSAQATRRNNCGNSSAVERQPSKLGVAGSNPVSRSRFCEPQDVVGLGPRRPRRADEKICEPQDVVGPWCEPQHGLGLGPRRPRRAREKTCAHVAQSAEHVLGKDGVTGSSPVMGSIRAPLNR